jgi:hypothetical protein
MSEENHIYYKGERVPLKITNSVLMRFRRLGGELDKLESDPVSQAITLLCAALKLQGDPIDHADDFPPVAKVADSIRQAVERYNGDGDAPGEPSGDAIALSPESATD